MTTKGLVPEDTSDFRSGTFWQGFFDCRGDRPFEWYGDWRQLKPLAAPLCGGGRRVLVLGCGNSELSANMYDDGIKDITNIDFVKSVVAAMMRKNLRIRPRMKWQVMDMTAMKFADGTFDVAFDKGGLDALMGDEGAEADEAGLRLLGEVARVVHPATGVYFCVTLAQEHVLRTLLSALGEGWATAIHKPPPPPDMARAPLQPLLVVARRVPPPAPLPPVRLSFSAHLDGPDSEQIRSVLRVVQEVNAQRAKFVPSAAAALGHRGRPGTGGGGGGGGGGGDALAELHPGGRLELQTAAGAKAFVPAAPVMDGKAPRFMATVVDQQGDAAERAVRLCGVFIVPQGREHEWLFSSPEGQQQLAAGCASRRVVIVSLGRGHTFPPMAKLKKELSPLVLPLAPALAQAAPATIPFMSIGEDIGRRVPIATATSDLSGCIAVEDVTLQEDGQDKVYRRMVFTSNSNLVQSEAVMTAGGPQPDGGATSPPQSSSGGRLRVDNLQLPCEYHKAVIAGLSLAGMDCAV